MEITKELRDKIKKSLPLKIFERREEAKEIERSLEFSKRLLSDLSKINPNSESLVNIEFTGKNIFGNRAEVSTGVYPSLFKRLSDVLLEAVKVDIKNRQRKLDEIPDAKIIPFNFRKKEVQPDRRLYPERRVEPLTVYKGGHDICKAAGLKGTHQIPYYVENEGFPAFKIKGKKFWFAFPNELDEWKEQNEMN